MQHKSNNVSGHPNISIVPLKKGGTRYHVRVLNRGVEVLNKCFRDLESAIKARDAAFERLTIKKPEQIKIDITEDSHVFRLNGFHIDKKKVYYHRNGFISVQLSWDASVDRHCFKFAVKDPTYEPAECSYRLHFYNDELLNKNKLVFHPSFEIVLSVGPNDKKYVPVFHDDLEYGAVVWFAPLGWKENELAEEIN